VPLFQIVVWVVVLAAMVRAMIRTRDRRLTITLTLVIVGWGWIAANIGASEALVHESGIAGVMPPSAVQGDEPGTFVGVDGDKPFHVVMTVTNASRLPLELRGLVVSTVPDTHDPPLGPRFVALGTFPTGNIVLDEVQAFRPVTLQSGAMVDLVVLGMAGSCALAAPPADRIGGGFTWLDSVNLVYEQLTIVHSEPVLLSDRVNVWWPDSCSS
jgi:hypothetical protein